MASHGVPRASGPAIVKSEKAKAKEREQIQRYRNLEKDVRDRMKAKDYSHDSLQSTSTLLQSNPEYYTIWNDRRIILLDVIRREVSGADETVPAETTDINAAAAAGLTTSQREVLLIIKEDLQFLLPLLKQYPKCYWIWNHRSWLLQTAMQHVPDRHSIELWQTELGLVTKMLALDNRNFHGWEYRRIVVRELERLSTQSMAESEFAYTTKMIETNLSNFSAWHARGQLIPRMLDERGASTHDRSSLFDAEVKLIDEALYLDPDDQSLWFYHHYLMASLDPSNPHAARILDPCTDELRVKYLEQELKFIKDMVDEDDSCKYTYQALIDYTEHLGNLQAKSDGSYLEDMASWFDKLEALDPLRRGRWRDQRRRLGLTDDE